LVRAHDQAIEILEPSSPVALNTVDWNEVEAGKLAVVPVLIRLGDGFSTISSTNRTEGDWIYVGSERESWDSCDSASNGVTQKQAIAHMKATSFSALYQYQRDGIAKLIASKSISC